MATSRKALRDQLREKYIEQVSRFLKDLGEEVLVTNSNEIALPCVDGEGNEEYVVITFKVPTGSRDGEGYDGHAVAEDYALHCANKAAKAEKAKAEKAAKIAKDKTMRAKRKAEKAE